MSERGYEHILVEMPLCASERGRPMVVLPCSRFRAYADDIYLDLLKRYALDTLERARREHHGDQLQLPSLDPDDWYLRSRTRQVLGSLSEVYEIVPREV